MSPGPLGHKRAQEAQVSNHLCFLCFFAQLEFQVFRDKPVAYLRLFEQSHGKLARAHVGLTQEPGAGIGGLEKLMKYMLLVHHDEAAFRNRSENERQNMLQESVQLANQLHTRGHYLSAAPLHPTSETTCVRVRDNKRLVTDGPFAETREQIGGYFLIEARDINEAIEIASRIPGARIGTVEVRPVTEVAGLPKIAESTESS